MKIGAIVQARFSSTRLPGKILKELPFASGITVLEQVIRRLKQSKKLNEIIVATTVEKSDNKIVNIAEKEKITCFRGSQEDVLSRYYLAARENNLDMVVRATSDCPCHDSEIIDLIIEECIQAEVDYATNSFKKTYPRGLDVEVFNFDSLEKSHKNACEDYEREHVTPYIYRNPTIFKIIQVEATRHLYAPEIRITLDTEEDYALLCSVFDYLYPQNKFFNTEDIIKLFNEKPWLKLINKKSVQKKIALTLDEEIKEAIRILELQDLKKAKGFLEANLKYKAS